LYEFPGEPSTFIEVILKFGAASFAWRYLSFKTEVAVGTQKRLLMIQLYTSIQNEIRQLEMYLEWKEMSHC